MVGRGAQVEPKLGSAPPDRRRHRDRRLRILQTGQQLGPASNDSDANTYLADYGGSEAVYDRILRLSDCAALQVEFDTAAANNEVAEPGAPQHRQTTGYMDAADDRMRAIGCY